MDVDVSVIIPHFNALDTINKSIQSVINQTVKVREIIIVDDCSSDFNELNLIAQRFSECKTSIIVKRLFINSGASEARNHGIKFAIGKYLAFLDSDDIWHPEKIAIQYAYMESENLHISGHLYIPNVKRKSMTLEHKFSVKHLSSNDFILGNPFFTPTVMVRRDSFISFDRRYRRVDDYKCWLMNVSKNPGVLLMLSLAGGFKPAIGFAGLTSSIKVMHDSYISVLSDLYREHHVGLTFFLAAWGVEQLKYPFRIFRNRILRGH